MRDRGLLPDPAGVGGRETGQQAVTGSPRRPAAVGLNRPARAVVDPRLRGCRAPITATRGVAAASWRPVHRWTPPSAVPEKDCEREGPAEQDRETVLYADSDQDRACGDRPDDGEDGLDPEHGRRSRVVARSTTGGPEYQPCAVSEVAEVEAEAREHHAHGAHQFPEPSGVVGRGWCEQERNAEDAGPDQGDRDEVAPPSRAHPPHPPHPPHSPHRATDRTARHRGGCRSPLRDTAPAGDRSRWALTAGRGAPPGRGRASALGHSRVGSVV
jgi:hypothetical protein